MTILPLAFFDSFLSPSTMLLLLVVAVLLYGERLPEVAKAWGKQFMDLKKSFQGLRDQFDSVTRDITSSVDTAIPRVDWTRGPRGGDGSEIRASAEPTRPRPSAPRASPRCILKRSRDNSRWERGQEGLSRFARDVFCGVAKRMGRPLGRVLLFGRLAQLVERYRHKVEVTGSSPVTPTQQPVFGRAFSVRRPSA